jgi:hypothetical protein
VLSESNADAMLLDAKVVCRNTVNFGNPQDREAGFS